MSSAGGTPPAKEPQDATSVKTHESVEKPVTVDTPQAPPPPTANRTAPTLVPGEAADIATVAKHAQHTQPATGVPVPPAPAPAPKGPAIPESIVFHKSPDGDDFGIKAFFEGATHPMTYHYFRTALRTTAFVSFPMFTVASNPNTIFKMGFPHMIVASVISSSTHRGTLGEQLGMHTWTWRGITYELIIGTIADAVSLVKHIGAWYGYIAVGIFIGSLNVHSGIRRFYYLYFFVYTLLIRMSDLYFGFVAQNSAAWFACDHYTGSALGTMALLFPYPVLAWKIVDKVIAKLFAGMGKMVMAMQMFAFSPDVHAAHVFFQDYTPFEKIEGGLAMMPALLWFVNWEPTEFAIRNPIRQLKMAFLRRILALAYAAFDCGRLISRMRCRIDELTAAERMKDDLRVPGNGGGGTPTEHGSDSEDDWRAAEEAEKQEATDREGVKALRKNKLDLFKAATMVLAQCITLVGSAHPTPREIVRKVPFALLEEKHTAAQRAGRMEMIQVLCLQREQVLRHSAEKERNRAQAPAASHGRQGHPQPASPPRHVAGSSANEELSESQIFSARGVEEHSPFGHRANLGMLAENHFASPYDEQQPVVGCYDPRWEPKLNKDEYRIVAQYTDIITDIEVNLLLQQIFFRMLMGMIANEVDSFRDLMENYKQPKPMFWRLVDYYLLEPWHDFWEGVWAQLTFATPAQVRIFKDALKMAGVYLSATAATLQVWTVPNGTYFFGVTAVMGLPGEEETLYWFINRMTGNTLGCSIGYFAVHNAHHLSQMIATMLAFAFVCRLVQNHRVFGQAFFYGGVISITGTATAIMTLELVTRLITGIYTLGAYHLTCTVLFPTNPRKVLWNYRMKFTKVMSEIVDDIALAARAPLVCSTRTDDNGAITTRPDGTQEVHMELDELGYPLPSKASALCAQMNLQLKMLRRMLVMCNKWTPFAAVSKQIRGTDLFPNSNSGRVHGSQTRLTADIQLLVFGIQLLHRPRNEPPHPMIERLLSGPIAEFLENFAGGIRLLSQDFIDSLQRPRAFSYPEYLSHVGYLSRMRVRLRMIMFISYVFLNEHYGGGSSQKMSGEGYDTIRDEVLQRAVTEGSPFYGGPQESAASPQGGPSTDGSPLAHADSSLNRAASGVGSWSGGGATGPRACTTLSFTDRFLTTHQSLYASPSNPASRAQTSVLLPQGSTMMSTSSVPANGSPGGINRHKSYRFRAALEEEPDVPNGDTLAVPAAPQDPLAQHMRDEQAKHYARAEHEKRKQARLQQKARKAGAVQGIVADEHSDSHVAQPPQPPPVDAPSTLRSAVTRFLRKRDPGGAGRYVPPYRGPNFSYREDDLDTAADTDFRALVCILSSCSAIISEMARMAAPVGAISTNQKEQHESTFILSLLDRLSDKYHDRKKAVHARYHYPPPPPQKRTELTVQYDMFASWSF